MAPTVLAQTRCSQQPARRNSLFSLAFKAIAYQCLSGYKGSPYFRYRSVAQPGRALRSGRRGRRFESSHSDHYLSCL